MDGELMLMFIEAIYRAKIITTKNNIFKVMIVMILKTRTADNQMPYILDIKGFSTNIRSKIKIFSKWVGKIPRKKSKNFILKKIWELRFIKYKYD